jgi:hypothetical protein
LADVDVWTERTGSTSEHRSRRTPSGGPERSEG